MNPRTNSVKEQALLQAITAGLFFELKNKSQIGSLEKTTQRKNNSEYLKGEFEWIPQEADKDFVVAAVPELGSNHLGVFAAKPFKKNDPVFNYVGEEIKHVEDFLNDNPYSTDYFFEIQAGKTCGIDGLFKGGTPRYCNHSSTEANVKAKFENGKMVFYALKTIHPGDEIIINYGKEYFINGNKEIKTKPYSIKQLYKDLCQVKFGIHDKEKERNALLTKIANWLVDKKLLTEAEIAEINKSTLEATENYKKDVSSTDSLRSIEQDASSSEESESDGKMEIEEDNIPSKSNKNSKVPASKTKKAKPKFKVVYVNGFPEIYNSKYHGNKFGDPEKINKNVYYSQRGADVLCIKGFYFRITKKNIHLSNNYEWTTVPTLSVSHHVPVAVKKGSHERFDIEEKNRAGTINSEAFEIITEDAASQRIKRHRKKNTNEVKATTNSKQKKLHYHVSLEELIKYSKHINNKPRKENQHKYSKMQDGSIPISENSKKNKALRMVIKTEDGFLQDADINNDKKKAFLVDKNEFTRHESISVSLNRGFYFRCKSPSQDKKLIKVKYYEFLKNRPIAVFRGTSIPFDIKEAKDFSQLEIISQDEGRKTWRKNNSLNHNLNGSGDKKNYYVSEKELDRYADYISVTENRLVKSDGNISRKETTSIKKDNTSKKEVKNKNNNSRKNMIKSSESESSESSSSSDKTNSSEYSSSESESSSEYSSSSEDNSPNMDEKDSTIPNAKTIQKHTLKKENVVQKCSMQDKNQNNFHLKLFTPKDNPLQKKRSLDEAQPHQDQLNEKTNFHPIKKRKSTYSLVESLGVIPALSLGLFSANSLQDQGKAKRPTSFSESVDSSPSFNTNIRLHKSRRLITEDDEPLVIDVKKPFNPNS